MVTSNEIDVRLERLHETYGDFPVESTEYNFSSDDYRRAQERHDCGIPGATRVWVEHDGATLLVREENRLDSWGVAGGLIDPGERADHAGEREVREETNIACEVVDVAYVHRATIRHEDSEREVFDEIAVAVIAEYVRGDPRPQEGEIRQVKWWKTLPEKVHSPADRIGANRLEL